MRRRVQLLLVLLVAAAACGARAAVCAEFETVMCLRAEDAAAGLAVVPSHSYVSHVRHAVVVVGEQAGTLVEVAFPQVPFSTAAPQLRAIAASGVALPLRDVVHVPTLDEVYYLAADNTLVYEAAPGALPPVVTDLSPMVVGADDVRGLVVDGARRHAYIGLRGRVLRVTGPSGVFEVHVLPADYALMGVSAVAVSPTYVWMAGAQLTDDAFRGGTWSVLAAPVAAFGAASNVVAMGATHETVQELLYEPLGGNLVLSVERVAYQVVNATNGDVFESHDAACHMHSLTPHLAGGGSALRHHLTVPLTNCTRFEPQQRMVYDVDKSRLYLGWWQQPGGDPHNTTSTAPPPRRMLSELWLTAYHFEHITDVLVHEPPAEGGTPAELAGPAHGRVMVDTLNTYLFDVSWSAASDVLINTTWVANENVTLLVPTVSVTFARYNTVPRASSLEDTVPPEGRMRGGTSVTLRGYDFAAVSVPSYRVRVDTQECLDATRRVGFNLVTCIVDNPDNRTGLATDIELYISGVRYVYEDVWDWLEPPTVTNISPRGGANIGGTTLTINGTSFGLYVQTPRTISLDGFLCSPITVISREELRCVVSQAATLSGTTTALTVTVDLLVATNPADLSWTWLKPPSVRSISPSLGNRFGNTRVTVVGDNLTPETVLFTPDQLYVSIGPAECKDWAFMPEYNVTVGDSYKEDVTVHFNETKTLTRNITRMVNTTELRNVTRLVNVTELVDGVNVTALANVTTVENVTFVETLHLKEQYNVTTAKTRVEERTVHFNRTELRTALTCTTFNPNGTLYVDQAVGVCIDGQCDSLDDGWSYLRAPNVTDVMPPYGGTLGNEIVTLYGHDFGTLERPPAEMNVTIDGIPCINVRNSASMDVMYCTSPNSLGRSGPRRPVQVSIDRAVSLEHDGWNWVPTPVVHTVQPASGRWTGNTTITITGANFGNVPYLGTPINATDMPTNVTVTLGNEPCLFAWPAGRTINATGDGTDRIVCTTWNPGGSTAADQFVSVGIAGVPSAPNTLWTWLLDPFVFAVTPSAGTQAGGSRVTLRGRYFGSHDFPPAREVFIDGEPCIELISIPDFGEWEQMACTTVNEGGRNETNRPVTVTVDRQTTVTPKLWSWLGVPLIKYLNPTAGRNDGGTTVSVHGYNFGPLTFTPRQEVYLDGFPCVVQSFVHLNASDGEQVIVCVSDVGNARPQFHVRPIEVIIDFFPSPKVYEWEWLTGPILHTVSPRTSDYRVDALNVTLTGEQFGPLVHAPGTFVTIDDQPCHIWDIVKGRTLRCLLENVGRVTGRAKDVRIDVDGVRNFGNDLWSWITIPEVTHIVPQAGTENGGTRITVHGTSFQYDHPIARSVLLDGVPCVDVVKEPGVDQVTCTTQNPLNSTGTDRLVQLTMDGYVGDAVPAWEWLPQPRVDEVWLPFGKAGYTVTVRGEHFGPDERAPDVAIFLGSERCADVAKRPGEDTFTCTVVNANGDTGAARFANVRVDGVAAESNALWEWMAAPAVTAIIPDGGREVGGTNITIVGERFYYQPSRVDIGEEPCEDVHWYEWENRITCHTRTLTRNDTHHEPIPPHRAGAPRKDVDVVVDGLPSPANGLWQWLPPPEVALVTPQAGKQVGNSRITVVGRYFGTDAYPPSMSVYIGNSECTDVVKFRGQDTIACTTGGPTVEPDDDGGDGGGGGGGGRSSAGGVARAGGRKVVVADYDVFASGLEPTDAMMHARRSAYDGDDAEMWVPPHVPSTDVWLGTEQRQTPQYPRHDTLVSVVIDGVEPVDPPATLWEWLEQPTIVGLEPHEGTVEGGVRITINGTNFGPDVNPPTRAVIVDGVSCGELRKTPGRDTLTCVLPKAVGRVGVDMPVTVLVDNYATVPLLVWEWIQIPPQVQLRACNRSLECGDCLRNFQCGWCELWDVVPLLDDQDPETTPRFRPAPSCQEGDREGAVVGVCLQWHFNTCPATQSNVAGRFVSLLAACIVAVAGFAIFLVNAHLNEHPQFDKFKRVAESLVHKAWALVYVIQFAAASAMVSIDFPVNYLNFCSKLAWINMGFTVPFARDEEDKINYGWDTVRITQESDHDALGGVASDPHSYTLSLTQYARQLGHTRSDLFVGTQFMWFVLMFGGYVTLVVVRTLRRFTVAQIGGRISRKEGRRRVKKFNNIEHMAISAMVRFMMWSYFAISTTSFFYITRASGASETNWTSFKYGWAWIIVLCVAIGFPVFVYNLFETRYLELNTSWMKQRYGILYNVYGPQNAYFVLIFLAKRLLMAALLGMLDGFPLQQISWTIVIELIYTLIMIKKKPFVNMSQYYLEVSFQAMTFAILGTLYGFSEKHYGEAESWSLISLFLVMVVVTFLSSLYTLRPLFLSAKDEKERRKRRLGEDTDWYGDLELAMQLRVSELKEQYETEELPEEINQAMAIFYKYDEDHDEYLNTVEVAKLLHDMGFVANATVAQQLVKRHDRSGMGGLNFQDFATWWNKEGYIPSKLADEGHFVMDLGSNAERAEAQVRERAKMAQQEAMRDAGIISELENFVGRDEDDDDDDVDVGVRLEKLPEMKSNTRPKREELPDVLLSADIEDKYRSFLEGSQMQERVVEEMEKIATVATMESMGRSARGGRGGRGGHAASQRGTYHDDYAQGSGYEDGYAHNEFGGAAASGGGGGGGGYGDSAQQYGGEYGGEYGGGGYADDGAQQYGGEYDGYDQSYDASGYGGGDAYSHDTWDGDGNGNGTGEQYGRGYDEGGQYGRRYDEY